MADTSTAIPMEDFPKDKAAAAAAATAAAAGAAGDEETAAVDVAPELAPVTSVEEAAADEETESNDSVGKSKLDKEALYKQSVREHEQYPMREVVIGMPGGHEMRFNPFASLFAIIILWGVAAWCMIEPESASATLIEWRGTVTALFTWFYIGTNPCFLVFMIYVALRYGHVRLGAKDSTPEFEDITYFAMLFSAGIGVGLFFFGVSEPLWHQSDHWFANAGYHSQDEIDMFALNLTIFHWGITGWSQYLVVAVCAGLASFRFNLPLTLRSCFYPILGEYTWGWMGDIIDGFTIVTTVAGVCTSLGLGAFQIAAGLKRVGAIDEDLSDEKVQNVQVISIWVITCLATCSVISGVNVGIKYLSQLGFGMGMLLLFLVFILDKTNFILNLIVQEVGYYFQWSTFLLNFHTDAFGQLKEGEGRAVDGNAAATWWMDYWTVFYIGWWVAWAAFVGLFIARISRGRTIRSVVVYSFVCPLAYTILWFGVFGGVGLRQARQALELKELGVAEYNDTDHFLTDGSTYCYDVPQEDLVIGNDTVFTNSLIGVTPVCEFNPDDSDNAWFNVLFSFSYPLDFESGYGPFLAWLSLFTVAIYFITSSDSGSLIVDNLASNGFEDTHWLQRMFWAFTEGSVATALLVSGGPDALRALQAASILSGLPFTVFLVLMCFAILHMCRLAESNENDNTEVSMKEDYARRRVFSLPVFGGVFNFFEHLSSFFNTHEDRAKVMPFPTAERVFAFVGALLMPFAVLYRIYSIMNQKASDRTGNRLLTGTYGIVFFVWVSLFASMSVSRGFRAFAWSALFLNACILCTLRSTVRARFNIEGNMIADFLLAAFMYPQVLCQIMEELQENQEKEEVDV